MMIVGIIAQSTPSQQSDRNDGRPKNTPFIYDVIAAFFAWTNQSCQWIFYQSCQWISYRSCQVHLVPRLPCLLPLVSLLQSPTLIHVLPDSSFTKGCHIISSMVKTFVVVTIPLENSSRRQYWLTLSIDRYWRRLALD